MNAQQALEAFRFADGLASGAESADELDEMSNVEWVEENAPDSFTPEMKQHAQNILLEHHMRSIGRA